MSQRFCLPNLLSYSRIVLGLVLPFLILRIDPFAGVLHQWQFWLALFLFVFGALTDFWDGWIARKQNLETSFGRILDPTADKVFILGAMTSFALKGLYSYWFLVPLYLREIAVTFCRIVWMLKGKAIGAEQAGKIKLCLQVSSVLWSFVCLAWPNSFNFVLNDCLISVTCLVTLYSGFTFFFHNKTLLADAQFHRTVSALGVGYLKPCPGTYGSLLGLAIFFIVGRDFLLHLGILGFFLWLAYQSIPRMGLESHEDPLEIVIDEVCGILIAFLTIPITWMSLLTGFLLFRIFDTTKIPPLNWLEKKKGVNGIMWDDLGAGIYTWIILKLIFR